MISSPSPACDDRDRASSRTGSGAVARLLVGALVSGLGLVGPWTARPAAVQSDLDALMADVLASRDENWRKLRQYVLDEREAIDVRGAGGARLWGERRDYTWYIRDGFFVRSPRHVNGVAVPEAEREAFEEAFLARARAREEVADEADAPAAAASDGDPGLVPGGDEAEVGVSGLLRQTRRPGFVDSAYLLRFKFEPGRYAFVGREEVGGRETLRIEYYPERLFDHEQDDQERRRRERRRDRDEDVEAEHERLMNEASLVTLWIEPEARQIVRYTFDNVDLDFLPAAWFVRVERLQATMNMAEPFPDVWLPDRIEMRFRMMLAVGPVEATFSRDYLDYREADTGGRVIYGGPQ